MMEHGKKPGFEPQSPTVSYKISGSDATHINCNHFFLYTLS